MNNMMQLKVWLDETEPEIWRRLIVDPRLTLEQLHTVLQYSFGWTNSHLHQFHEDDGTRYAIPSPLDDDFDGPIIDERKTLLATVFDHKNKTITYEYDFGDSWMHIVQFEKMIDRETVVYPSQTFIKQGKGVFSGKVRAAMCIAGDRNGPPEDCGGIWGCQRIIELKTNPSATRDEDDRKFLESLGDWDPQQFELSVINQDIGRVRVKKAFADM